MMNRRDVLISAGGVATAAAFSSPASAQKAAADPRGQVAAVWRKGIGGRIVTAVSDGYVPFEAWHLPNIDPEARAALLREAFLPTEIYQGSVNAYVVDDGVSVTLIDAGSGSTLGPETGHLVTNLRAAGYAPEDVTTLLATHLHPDHIGGAYDGSRAAVFPNAEFVVSEADHAFWTDAGMKARAPDAARSLWDIAATALAAYEGRVRRFEGSAEILPGVAPVPLPGHTPGQAGYRLTDGADTMLIWADVIHVAPIQLKRPEVAFVFDTDPVAAAEIRRRTLERVSADRVLVGGMHLPFPGVGNIVRDAEGYDFVASRWGYDL